MQVSSATERTDDTAGSTAGDIALSAASVRLKNAEGRFRMLCVQNTSADPVEAEIQKIEYLAAKDEYDAARAASNKLWGF